MLVLAADTSGKNGSIALVRFKGLAGSEGAPFLAGVARSGEGETLDSLPLEGGTFSAQLVPQISALLAKHNLSKGDIDAFAVASGPGSFTGLRVGLAAIKALAEILRRPIAAVSLLEALAREAAREGRLLAALDAGRGEVYAGMYEIRDGKAAFIEERLITMTELLAVREPVITPDAKVAAALRGANRPVTLVPQLRADAVARWGYEKIQSGETVAPEALDATYIRRSDAEIKFSQTSR